MNRGSAVMIGRNRISDTRFNEAPIHESGKFLSITIPMSGSVASMRPRFMNRGSHGATSREGGGIMASMRPRFMNRGSRRVSRSSDRIVSPASMRPRFMNRGSVVRDDDGKIIGVSFNEAPIHESGKWESSCA